MGIAIVLVKIMPESPTSDLAQIKREAEKKLIDHGAKNLAVEEKPFAFGLKVLFFKFAWPEEKGTEIIEEMLSKIEEVSSVTIEDFRRAFG